MSAIYLGGAFYATTTNNQSQVCYVTPKCYDSEEKHTTINHGNIYQGCVHVRHKEMLHGKTA